jgi:hypothetical protein
MLIETGMGKQPQTEAPKQQEIKLTSRQKRGHITNVGLMDILEAENL